MRSFARALSPPARPHPLRAAIVGPAERMEEASAPVSLPDEMRLFFTAWLGGLVFFGTFLG